MSSDRRESYGDYLQLDRILGAQAPLSDAHDELLFIIQHQTSELWMKLAIHEIRSAIREIRADRLQPAFKMLTRVARIFEQLNGAWDVLRTMTPVMGRPPARPDAVLASPCAKSSRSRLARGPACSLSVATALSSDSALATSASERTATMNAPTPPWGRGRWGRPT